MNIQNILVPTDFSDCADNALGHAADIAKKTDANITLLHIIDVPETSYKDYTGVINNQSTNSFSEAPHMLALIRLTQKKIKERKEQYPDINIEEKIYFDKVHRQVHTFVEGNDVDLVVIGSNGVDGLDEVLIGSNTQKVIRNVKVPVLVVKGEKKSFVPKNVVYASDFSESSGKGMDLLKYFQEIYGTTLHLVKIITPNTFESTSASRERMRQFAERTGLKEDGYTINIFNYYTEEEGILSFAEEAKADLISLVTHGRSGFSRFLMGSIAENVSNHSSVPLLTFNLRSK
ncbi:MAG: universal stress protein [Bernardetiaceae bacterium]|nr:universal stress protein [Bernardetiaceae bacterium]